MRTMLDSFFIRRTVGLLTIVLGICACADNHDKPVDVQTLSEKMAAVRDYVPLYAVIAHRGSTYWAPEETESAWRWAREMGADYLESDLQCSKDGVADTGSVKNTVDVCSVNISGISDR